MILTAFPLDRDSFTKNQAFGYERPLWSGTKQPFPHFSPKLGCPIEIPTSINTDLVKIVELYNRNEPVVIERLAWRFDNQLYPFRAKYIRPYDMMDADDAMLFLPNIGTIHKKITGLDIAITSPLEFYLEQASRMDPRTLSAKQVYLNEICHNYRMEIDGLAAQQVNTLALKDFLAILDCDNPMGSEQFVIPKLAILDPLSMTFINRPLDARNVRFPGSGCNPFDTSSAKAVSIHHPEVTQYSPSQYHNVARSCDDISQQYSDVKLEYILSPCGYIMDQVTHMLVCRYLEQPNECLVTHYCASVVIDVHQTACREHPKWEEESHIVTLDITYGDEALIEIYTLDRQHCLFALHLDLAMIALCSADVIAQVA